MQLKGKKKLIPQFLLAPPDIRPMIQNVPVDCAVTVRALGIVGISSNMSL